jgi:hypothetical protein
MKRDPSFKSELRTESSAFTSWINEVTGQKVKSNRTSEQNANPEIYGRLPSKPLGGDF